GERFERPLEVESLRLHHERERVSGRLAAEAEVVLRVRPHVEGRSPFVVKWAQPEVAVNPSASQLGPRRDERNHVNRIEHAVARVCGVARHGANATGTVSASNMRMQYRSVMPAT